MSHPTARAGLVLSTGPAGSCVCKPACDSVHGFRGKLCAHRVRETTSNIVIARPVTRFGRRRIYFRSLGDCAGIHHIVVFGRLRDQKALSTAGLNSERWSKGASWADIVGKRNLLAWLRISSRLRGVGWLTVTCSSGLGTLSRSTRFLL